MRRGAAALAILIKTVVSTYTTATRSGFVGAKTTPETRCRIRKHNHSINCLRFFAVPSPIVQVNETHSVCRATVAIVWQSHRNVTIWIAEFGLRIMSYNDV